MRHRPSLVGHSYDLDEFVHLGGHLELVSSRDRLWTEPCARRYWRGEGRHVPRKGRDQRLKYLIECGGTSGCDKVPPGGALGELTSKRAWAETDEVQEVFDKRRAVHLPMTASKRLHTCGKILNVDHALTDTLADDLSDVLRVMPVPEEVGDCPLFGGGGESGDEGDLVGSQAQTVQANTSATLLAMREGEFRLIVEQVAEPMQSRRRCVRDNPGGNGIFQAFLCGPCRIERKPGSTENAVLV